MGLVVLAGINPPHEVISFGETVAACSGAEKVFLCRSRHDPNVLPPTVLFQEGKGGCFVANFFFGKKKYGIDITPRKDAGMMGCGQEVLSRIQDVHAHVVIQGGELFRQAHMPAQAHTKEEESVDSVERGTDTVPKTVFPELLVVPAEIWNNPRVLAIYRYVETMLWSENDPDFVLIDETCGKVHAMVRHLEAAFSASGGTVDDPLRILRENEIVAREAVRDDAGSSWWIFRFVENMPEKIEEEKNPLELWALRSRKPASSPVLVEVPESEEGGAVARMPVWTSKEVRLTAAYYYIAASFLADVPGFEMVDDTHGMVVGLHTKLEQGFDTNPGSVDRVVRRFQEYNILERQKGTAGQHQQISWIFRFCPDVPLLPEGLTPEELWHSRDKKKGRPREIAPEASAETISSGVSSGAEFITSATEVPETDASVVPLPAHTFTSAAPPEVSMPMSTSIAEKVRVLGEARRKIDRELAENAHALVVEIEGDISRRCRDAIAHIRTTLEPVSALISPADLGRIERMVNHLRAVSTASIPESVDETDEEESEWAIPGHDARPDVAAFLSGFKQSLT